MTEEEWRQAPLGTPRPEQPKIVRVLWRMQGPSRVLVARIERHPYGRELVIAFEDGDDVIGRGSSVEVRQPWSSAQRNCGSC